MTRSRPTPETIHSERLASSRSMLVAFGLAVVLCMTVLAGGVAGMPSGRSVGYSAASLSISRCRSRNARERDPGGASTDGSLLK